MDKLIQWIVYHYKNEEYDSLIHLHMLITISEYHEIPNIKIIEMVYNEFNEYDEEIDCFKFDLTYDTTFSDLTNILQELNYVVTVDENRSWFEYIWPEKYKSRESNIYEIGFYLFYNFMEDVLFDDAYDENITIMDEVTSFIQDKNVNGNFNRILLYLDKELYNYDLQTLYDNETETNLEIIKKIIINILSSCRYQL